MALRSVFVHSICGIRQKDTGPQEQEIPMQLHDHYTLPVLDMNGEGTGICKKDGAVLFVPGAVPEDLVEIEITDLQRNYAAARLCRLLTPSPYRKEPDCPHYSECGGCHLRHITREMELTVKENGVRQAMRRVGLTLPDSVYRPIRFTEPLHYRNKVVFHMESGQLGYYAHGTHKLLPGTENCLLLPEIFPEVARFTREYDLSDLCPEALYIRQTHDSHCTVTLQTPEKYQPHMASKLQAWAADLRAAFPHQVTGVLHSDHPKGKYAVPTYTLLTGERYLEENWDNVRMRISPEGFCQVNHAGAAILAETVVDFARSQAENLSSTEGPIHAADLYCGSGFFALHLAKAFPNWQIWGMEISAASIRDAKANGALNGFENLTFFCGDAAELPGKMGCAPAFAVIDPPRAGCSEKLCRQLIHMAPAAIAYVSCNPQTLARDLVRFQDGGYAVEAVQPVDMFPGTGHCETVCLLSKLHADQHIEVELNLDEMDLTTAENKATYDKIKEYVLENTGLKVSQLYIAQIKRKYGIIERANYNLPKSENAKVPNCPPDKEEAIVEALRHFGMIK